MSTSNSTVRFCKKCQADTERRTNGQCKVCAKASTAAWNAANPERKKANHAAWNAANPEKAKAYGAAWKKANKDKMKAYDAANRAANPERRRASRIARYAANPDKVKAARAAWSAANPEATRIHNHNRRARKRTNGGVLSKGLSAKLFKLQRGKCACCGLSLGDNYHLDHIVPIALGGLNTDGNMQLLRSICNLQKHAKHPVDFMQERGFLL